MGMDQQPASGYGVGPSVPEEGLDETLRSWSGKGELWQALAAVNTGVLAEVSWTATDIANRAYRVLFPKLLWSLSDWPTSALAWVDALPAETQRRRQLTAAPGAGTSWVDTRRLGWPPREFVGFTREREADSLLITSLRFTLETLRDVWKAATAVAPEIDVSVRAQLLAAERVLGMEPLASAESIPPSRLDITALRTQGRLWGAVAPVADILRQLSSGSLSSLARELIMPSSELRGRLFHLGVLGEVLIGLREAGAYSVSVTPLGIGAAGPAYRVRDSNAQEWHLWFEAAGIWRYYERSSPYLQAVAGLGGSMQAPIQEDILLILPGSRALIVECKHSWSKTYIGSGYHQAVSYAAEVMSSGLAGEVVAVVVGPDEVVNEPSFVNLRVGRVGFSGPRELRSLVAELMRP
jgi:hypothetical protein